MQKEIIAIGHSDKEFAGRLTDYINSHNLLPYPVAAFSEKGRLTRYENNAPVKIKIVEQGWEEREKKKNLGQNVFLFCDTKEEEGEMYVYRFRAADLSAKRIAEIAGMRVTVRTPVSGKTKLIGIYSPIGRCLKTSFSLTLGQMLSNRNRVLYLNFENYSAFGKVMGMTKPADMGDLLYYFLNLADGVYDKMDEIMVSVNGLDVIPPALSYLDIESITEEEWENFFDALIRKGYYDYIILDLSEYIKGLYRILRRCSYIYTFAPGDGLAMAKVEQYEKILVELHYKDVLDRTRKVTPPIFRKLPIKPEELLHSELADYTRKITEDDFHWSRL